MEQTPKDWAMSASLVIVLLYVFWLCRKPIWFYAEIWRRSRALRHLPGPQYGLLGIVPQLVSRKIHKQATTWANQFGPVYRVRFMCYHAMVVTDPHLARELLRCRQLDKFSYQYMQLRAFLIGPNLLSSRTDARYLNIRKGVCPAFNSGSLRTFVPLVRERVGFLVELLKVHGVDKPTNVDDLLLRLSMDVTGRFGLKKEFSALEGAVPGSTEGQGSYCQTLVRCCEEVWRRMSSPAATIFGLPRGLQRKGDASFNRWKVLVAGLLKHVKTVEAPAGSYADLLLKIRDPKTGQPLDDVAMMGEISTLLFGGLDTTSHTNAWTLYFLSQHPEVEAKVVAELEASQLLVTASRPQPRMPEYDDLQRLNYLKCVIKEVLRMVPPVGAGQIRVALKDDIVLCNGSLKLPRGTMVWVPHHAIQNCEHNWDEPTKFMPERWAASDAEYAQKPSALPKEWQVGMDSNSTTERARRFMPFADGIRTCIGQSLAMATMPLTLAGLLSHFSFKLADRMGGAAGVMEREQYTLVTGIKDGLWMHAVPRCTVPVVCTAAPSAAA
ncbi:g11778 [Coccomyxa elongata]